jgi:hypothetical protein
MADIEDDAAELANNLHEAARALSLAGSVSATLQAVVDLAGSTIDGCDGAGVLRIDDDRRLRAVAATGPVIGRLGAMESGAGEGPAHDAVANGTPSYCGDLGTDGRWPAYGPRAARSGTASELALRLTSSGFTGVLVLVSARTQGLPATERAKGVILAALGGLALAGAQACEDQDRRAENLHQGLATRELIGQAQGILMERDHVTADQAFDILRRSSQHLNVKLREVAQGLVDTGERPPTGPAGWRGDR